MPAELLDDLMSSFLAPAAPVELPRTAADSQKFAAVSSPPNGPENKHWRGFSQDSQDSQGVGETNASQAAANDEPGPGRAVFPPLQDPVPAGGRDVLGWLDILGPLTADELATAMQWPRGGAVGLALRLRDLGLIRQSGERWRLTPRAESVALLPASERPEPINARRPPTRP